MPKYKKGQVWNKPKNKLMLKFESETSKNAIYNNKVTGQFEYWLWQQQKLLQKQSPKSNLRELKKINIDKVLGILKHLTTAEGVRYDCDIGLTSNDVIWLRQTIEKPMKLYRGILLTHYDINLREKKIINKLKEGDYLPTILYKSYHFNIPYVSFTKSKNVAIKFAGISNNINQVSIVMEKNFQPNEMLVDISNLYKIIPKTKYREFEIYLKFFSFEKEKEVFIIEPVSKIKIIIKRGKFNLNDV